MTTQDVQDPFHQGFPCQVLSFCIVTASPDYQLKANRGQKTQTARVSIVDVLQSGNNPVFLFDHVEKVPGTMYSACIKVDGAACCC